MTDTRWFAPMFVLALGSGCVRVQLPKAQIVTIVAQEEGLAWQRAVQLALAHHPDLRQARDTLSAKAHTRNQALGAYLPSIDGTISRDRTRPTAPNASNSLSIGLDATQPIFTGFDVTGKTLQAWKDWEAAHWAYVEESATVRQQLRSAFVELLRLDQLLDVNRRIAQRRKDNAEMLRLLYESGKEDAGSSHRAQAIAEQAAFSVRQTERQIATQSLTLGRQLGGSFATSIPLVGDLEQMVPAEPRSPGDYVALAETAPTVQRLTRSAEVLKAAILSAQSKLWPTVNGTFSYGYSGTRPGDLQKNDTTLGLKVSVPLFHGGQNVQGVLKSNAEYQAAVETARSARDGRIVQLSSSWAAFQNSWEQVAVQHSFLEAARQRSEIVRAQYTNGLVNFQDFDISEQQLADAEQAHVQSLADVLNREADWRLAKGETLEDEVPHAK